MEKNLENKEIIYNLDYLVCLPEYDNNLYDAFKYSFKNVILIKDNVADINNIIQIIKNGNIKNIILVDFLLEYHSILKVVCKENKIKFILTKSLASITNPDIYEIVNNVFELNKKNIFKDLGVLDINWYKCLKNNNLNVNYIQLDVNDNNKLKSEFNKQKNIGIISNCYNFNQSFFNQLSAIKLNSKYNPYLMENNNRIKDFCKVFEINYNYYNNEKNNMDNMDEYIKSNSINLYINFTDNNISLFIKSMDNNIPCILGNTDILKNYPELEKLIKINSEDDINEIANKINIVSENKEKIMQLYKEFRKEYSLKSKESIQNFLKCHVDYEENNEKFNKLLSIVVPVYNTEKYIDECIQSIINSNFENMEILIINDGSTDNSEEVIKKWIDKYPNLIRYFKQDNHGLGNVRNVGLQYAKGKYIFSVDSDDTINSKFLNEAKEYLENDIDLVICDWLSIPENGDKFETSAIEYVFNNMMSTYKGLLYTTIMPSTCNKIIKRKLFDKIKFKYAEGLKYEDLSLNPLIMIEAETIKYINKPYYEYKIRGNSIMRTSAGYNMIDIIEMLNSRIEQLYSKESKVDVEELKYYVYIWRIEEFIFNQIYTMEEEKIEEFVEYTIKKIGNILLEIYTTDRYMEFLKSVKKETRQYLLERTNALKNGNLCEFLKEKILKKNYVSITAFIFFYGEK